MIERNMWFENVIALKCGRGENGKDWLECKGNKEVLKGNTRQVKYYKNHKK